MASEGSFMHIEKPQMRRNARSAVNASMRPAVRVIPSSALATKALASHARWCDRRPNPHYEEATHSSMRTHSSVSMSCSSLPLSEPNSCFSSGISSC